MNPARFASRAYVPNPRNGAAAQNGKVGAGALDEARAARCYGTERRAQDSNLYGLAPSGFQDRRLTS